MNLPFSPCSSLGISANSTHSASGYSKLFIKPTCKADCSMLKTFKHSPSLPVQNHKIFSRTLQMAHYRRHSIWACSQVGAAGSDPLLNKVSQFKEAFWRFLRPHTIRGTTLGSVSLVARALIENPNLIRWSLFLLEFL
ncbi:Homogentisate solanesyltransferase [Abeliophyllum distichum]|uniref:Homogentisate solanesyltransferase n=1 Tax=Abeliophyllum distichum TaxID=126358 RepID=A0ABD1V1N8_9LAMI